MERFEETEDPIERLEREEEAEELAEKPGAKRKKILRILVVIVFLAANGIVLFFTARNDFSKPAQPLSGSPFSGNNLLFLLGAVGCLVAAIAAETVKYLLMMHRLRERVSLRTAFETSVLGKYYDYITPSGAGGQPFQIWHLHTKGYPAGACSAMPLASFVTMQLGFVLLALVMFLTERSASDVVGIKIAAYIGLALYAFAPILIVLSALAPKVVTRIVAFFVRIGAKLRIIKNPAYATEQAEYGIKRYSDSLKMIAKSRILVALFALSILYQIALCSIPFFVVNAFGGRIGFWQSLTMCLYVYASVAFVPTPGNAGAAEGSFYLLFNQLDVSGLFWAMLIWRFLCYYSFLLMGLGIYAVHAIEKATSRWRIKK